MSIVLILAGTILLKSTENITWLQAFFHSVSARTAGFSTTPLGEFTNAGLFVLVILMFIGASPWIYWWRYQNKYILRIDYSV